MEKIKLIAASDPENPLIKIFLDSIKDEWDIKIIEHGVPTDIVTDEFYATIREKYRRVVDYIRTNQGKLLIISDVDIQFFKPATPEMLKALEGNEIVFLSREVNPDIWKKGDVVNVGFIITKCNQKTLRFFKIVLNAQWEKSTGEQGFMNQLLLNSEFKYGVFPHQFWMQRHSKGIPPQDIILHHAVQEGEPESRNQASRLKMKIDQLNKIKEIINGTIQKST